MTPEQKKWIDEASYEALFRKVRYAPIGDPMFVGEVGEYITQKYAAKRAEVGNAEHVRVSKAIGWKT